MTDKVQKIRKEVVEIINSTNPFIPDEDGKNSNYEAGKLDAATKILQIIDSLEEPVSEDLEEAINSYIENNFHGSQTLGFFSNRTKEEPNDEDIALTFKAGAEWQKEQIMSKAIVYNDKIYPTTYENEPTEFCLDGGEEVRLITEAVNSGLLKQGGKVKVIIVKED